MTNALDLAAAVRLHALTRSVLDDAGQLADDPGEASVQVAVVVRALRAIAADDRGAALMAAVADDAERRVRGPAAAAIARAAR